MRHTLKNQIIYREYKKTLPHTIWDWTDESLKEFSAVAKQALLVLNIFTFFIQLFEIRAIYRRFFRNVKIGVDDLKQQYKQLSMDILFIVITIVIDIQVILVRFLPNIYENYSAEDIAYYRQTRINYMQYIRIESLIIVPLLFIKIINIFTLFDNISPFVDIVFKIFSDITFFMFIFFITIISAAQMFYIIG